MVSHTDPIDSIQLNIKLVCIFEYGNLLYGSSTPCGKNVVYMWSLWHTLDNFACWANWIIQGKNNMKPDTDPRVSIQIHLKPIFVFEYGNQLYGSSTPCCKSVVYMCSLWHMLDNFACWKNWIIQGKKHTEPATDPRASVQLNLKPICIIEYGNQWYINWSCCGKSIVYMWFLCHALYNFACWSNLIIQATNNMEPNTDSRVSVLRNAIPIGIVL